MININFLEELSDNEYKIIDNEFNKYAIKNEVECNYKSFNFIAVDNSKVVGIITGHTYYKEIHIGDLIVLEEYRGQGIGKQLIEKVEEHYKNSEFENINLTTYQFQAPEFYKKCGFEVEFIRKNKNNEKLSKYFLVKYLK